MDGHVVLEAFSFGPFRVVPCARLLECDGTPAPLGSRAFDILCLLISRAGEVVSKRELMARVWPNEKVEESSLRFHISLLRRALGDGKGGERYVVNISGRGYCFVAGVSRAA
jgi:DNA-binding winged helix-turn-helix (wHTH) protein